MPDHKIATREEWAAVRAELLAREKEHTRLGDELARQRRELPWLRVEEALSAWLSPPVPSSAVS